MQIATIFNENVSHFMDAEIIKLLLPVSIGDMRIVKSYCYREEAPFDFPSRYFWADKIRGYLLRITWDGRHIRKNLVMCMSLIAVIFLFGRVSGGKKC